VSSALSCNILPVIDDDCSANIAAVVMVLLVLTLGLFGAIQSGISCTFLDISPSFSSEINTIGNTVSAIAGVLGPIIIAELIAAFDGRTGWMITFYITLGMSVFALVLWKIYMKAEVIPEINTPKPAEADASGSPNSPASNMELVRNHAGSSAKAEDVIAAGDAAIDRDAIVMEPLEDLESKNSPN
jgi:MFS family permease